MQGVRLGTTAGWRFLADISVQVPPCSHPVLIVYVFRSVSDTCSPGLAFIVLHM